MGLGTHQLTMFAPPSAATDGFNDFWAAYPRKVGKGDAEKAYREALLKRVADRMEIIAGARRYARERAGKDPQFTPYPGTWLRAKRWLDEEAPQEGGSFRDVLDELR